MRSSLTLWVEIVPKNPNCKTHAAGYDDAYQELPAGNRYRLTHYCAAIVVAQLSVEVGSGGSPKDGNFLSELNKKPTLRLSTESGFFF